MGENQGDNMSINMQGSWTISVKQKAAAYKQRFTVEGADSGNGVYEWEADLSPVQVSGASWSIRVEHSPGSSWNPSDDRIKFPTLSGGYYKFQIETNDSGSDSDYNDLILECSTPYSSTDFIVYGNVTTYSGWCWYNPCRLPWVIIDTPWALERILEIPELKIAVQERYPTRIKEFLDRSPDVEYKFGHWWCLCWNKRECQIDSYKC